MSLNETTDPNATQAAAQCLLRAYHLPAGVRTLVGYLLTTEAPPTVALIAREMDLSDRTVGLWIRQAKEAGLLTVRRVGRRNIYTIDFDRLQALAERGGA